MVMVNGLTLEEAILEEIKDARNKQEKAEDIREQAEKDIKYWSEYADALEKSLELRKQHGNLSNQNNYRFLDAEQLKKQSTWRNLQDIMLANKGVLVVIDATNFLVDVKVFTDKDHARNLIYSTLWAHKKDVEKVRSGVYRSKEMRNLIAHGQLEPKTELKLGNTMSFRTGVERVLKEAQGEPMYASDIWQKMQSMGIRSTAKDPIGWVDWTARQLHAEKIAPHQWLFRPMLPKFELLSEK